MGIITVERHVFFLQAKEYSGGQVQMWVRNVRLPWGKGTSTRTVGYLDDAQFGALSKRVGGQDIENMKRFFLGKGFAHPNLIVARVAESDFFTRPEMGKRLFDQFKQQLKGISFSGQGDIPEEEDERFLTHAQRMARYKTGGPRTGSRSVAKPLRGPEQMYRPHYSQHYFNTVWLLVDPTRPGRQTVPKDRAIRLAKKVLGTRFSNILFPDQRKKVMDKDSIVILGVGYLMQYWQKRVPSYDVRWLESIQARVRKHLGAELKITKGRVDPTQTWYAMGKQEMPPISQRFQTTKQGRVRHYKTFRAGHGLVSASPEAQFSLKPLFTVKARNIVAAKDAAERKLVKMIRNPSTAEQGYDFEAAWYAANRKMVSLAAVRMLKNQ